MKPILVAENISKKFSKGENVHSKYGIRNLVNEILGRKRNDSLREDEFHAVNDISFTLYPGDTLAIVGRNGCGKTTTLKMLNGTLKPDKGRIIVHGRIQALIALGAGFDIKLSGRDNVFNSAAVLGMSRNETSSIIDEIVAFSELEEFIDSPVQTYSSGMYARLGFSIAVHLKPQILLIDEILSVGDHAFQNKCFRKMQELKESGVTFILVSHSHTSVVQLCENAIWLHKGKLVDAGPSKEIVKSYLYFLDQHKVRNSNDKKYEQKLLINSESDKKSIPKLYGPIYDDFDKIDELSVQLYVHGKKTDIVKIHDELIIEYKFKLMVSIKDLNVSLNIYRKDDGLLYTTISTLNGDIVKHINSGMVSCRVTIKDFNITAGDYILLMPIHSGNSYLYRNIVKDFHVTGIDKMTWGLIDFEYEYSIN